ncbi:uncharacterized protein MONBRDRAFT_30128, partial [Monosiga brevicollis MX1]
MAVSVVAEVEVSCAPVGGQHLLVNWTAQAETDFYAVQLHLWLNDSTAAAPFWRGTTQQTSFLLEDLRPNIEYAVSVRTHPDSAPSIVWHWRNDSAAPRRCALLAGPSVVDRSALVVVQSSTHALVVQAASSVQQLHLTRLGRRDLTERTPTRVAQVLARPSQPDRVLGIARSGVIEIPQLEPASLYLLAADGYQVLARTAAPGVTFLSVYRVSEYTTEVDYLANHNSAGLAAQAAFLTNTNSALFFNVSLNPPVTEYCVARQADLDFAPYVSCNGPEAEPRNQPEDPMCICDVWADRMIALQTSTDFQQCDPITWGPNHTHDDPACYCFNGTSRSKWNMEPASQAGLGRSDVFLPFFYYQGFGQLPEKQPDKCSWSTMPGARIVYGNTLLDLGWNATD